MTENEKIEQIIQKYDSYFQNSNADVGHTSKNMWFFYDYDEAHDYYNSFIRFHSAEELEQIIIGMIADDLNLLIEIAAENTHYALRDININDAVEKNYEDCIPKLLENMEVLNIECQKSAGKIEIIFKALSGILITLQKEVPEKTQECNEIP